MLEKDIVNAIKKMLITNGAWVVKTHGSIHTAGLPDLLACYQGQFIALEVKRPETRHTVTARQQAFLDAIEAAGGVAGVVTSCSDVRSLFEDRVEPIK